MNKMNAEYVDHMGNDDMIADVARVSFAKQASNYTPEQNSKLIRYLVRHNHWSPLSHPQIQLRLTVPIFIARQDFKHVVGFSRNEVSRRYVDEEPTFFVPKEWRERAENKKQGSGGKHTDSEEIKFTIDVYHKEIAAAYNRLLSMDIAPEQARMILPQSMYTQYITTGSLAAWARAYNQRVGEGAQKEINELYKTIGDIIKPLFPVSWAALTSTDK